MSDDRTLIHAEEARQFLSNPLFKMAFEGVASDLHQAALSCDPDNKEKTQRIVIAQQLLEAVKREVVRKVQDGEMAAFQMKELQPRGVVRRIFQR